MPESNLTERQEQFCQEYLIDLNGLQAAIRAGYSPKTANSQGARLLGNASIAARVQELKLARSQRTEITQERVLRELARIAFGDPRKVMSWGPDGVKLVASDSLTDDDAAMVSEVSESTTKDGGSLRLKCHDKLAALEKLGRHLGMFAGGPVGLTVDRPVGPGFTGTLEELLITLRRVTVEVKPE